MHRHIRAALTAFERGIRRLFEVVLHIGAHRTGTTSLQHHLHNNQLNLNKNGIAYWGPERTRSGLFAGLVKEPARLSEADRDRARYASALIGMELDRLASCGTRQLVVSEENMIGDMRCNLDARALYPSLRRRLARFRSAFAGRCRRIALAVRCYDDYWASALAYSVTAGHPPPGRGDIARLAGDRRGWRDVVADVAEAFPDAEIVVWNFDSLKGRLAEQVTLMTGLDAARIPAGDGRCHNASATRRELRQALRANGARHFAGFIERGDGRFMPFDTAARAEMQWRYAEDLAWLRAGAGGLARYSEKAGEETPAHMTVREEQFRVSENGRLGASG